MPRLRKMGAFTLRPITLITLKKSKRSRESDSRLCNRSRLMSICRRADLGCIFRAERRADSLAGAAKDFACEITLRFPTILTKPQCHCAGLILAEEFNAPFLQVLGPRVADSFVTRESRAKWQ